MELECATSQRKDFFLKAQAGNESSNIIPKFSHARKKPPHHQAVSEDVPRKIRLSSVDASLECAILQCLVVGCSHDVRMCSLKSRTKKCSRGVRECNPSGDWFPIVRALLDDVAQPFTQR